MRRDDIVTASEIGDFVFCPESWRLSRLGVPSSNQGVRDEGTAHHGAKTDAEVAAGGAIALGRVLIILAAAIVLALVTSWTLGR